MTVRLSRLLGATAFCVATVSAAQADTVVSNLGDGDGYMSGAAWVVAGPDAPFYNAMGMGFTASGNYDVSEIDTWFAADNPGQQLTLTLWTDVEGHFGTQLGSWSGLTPGAVGFNSSVTPTTVTGISGITLTAGSQYWLEASTTGSNWIYWDDTSSSATGPSRYVDATYGDYATISSRQGAFAIQGTVAAVDTGSVPEPASWALMLGGFGMIGGALRSRRKAAVTFA